MRLWNGDMPTLQRCLAREGAVSQAPVQSLAVSSDTWRSLKEWLNLGAQMTTEKCDELERSLIEMAVESWRFARLFSRLVSKLDAGDGTRYVNQLRYFQKKIEDSLEASGMKIVNVEGQPFDPGMAASAINIGDFGPEDLLLVDQMVEPIIMGAEGLRKQGTVMLRKVAV